MEGPFGSLVVLKSWQFSFCRTPIHVTEVRFKVIKVAKRCPVSSSELRQVASC
jgi:hypothetical protein